MWICVTPDLASYKCVNLNIKNVEPAYSFILVSTLHDKIQMWL